MRKRFEIDLVTEGKFRAIWDKIKRSKPYDRMDDKERTFLKSLLFGNVVWPYLPLCNMFVEVGARLAMQQTLSDWVEEHPERKEGVQRIRMITMLFADQFVDFDQPEVDLRKVKNRVRRILEALGLHGFAIIEMQPTLLPKAVAEGQKRRVCIHAHGICWSDDREFKPKVAIGKLNKTRLLGPVFGCEAVQIKAAKLQSKDSLDRIVSYIVKQSAGVTKVSPTPPGSKRPYRIYANKDGWTGPMAIRSIEMLSQFSVFDLSIATGEASQLRARWKRILRTQLFSDVAGKFLEPDAISRFWQKAMMLDPKRNQTTFC